jgi:hypothetical protein
MLSIVIRRVSVETRLELQDRVEWARCVCPERYISAMFWILTKLGTVRKWRVARAKSVLSVEDEESRAWNNYSVHSGRESAQKVHPRQA